MAIYHFSVQVLGRGKVRRNLDGTPRKTGDNAVKAAAYRAGARLRDERTGTTHDYSNRRGIAHAEIMAPDGCAVWLTDRERLWNEVERLEGRRDSQLAREINIALPHELGHEQRMTLVRDFVREQFVSQGMVADIALHDPVPEKGDDPRNVHAHVMLTMRKATRNGLHSVKTREWNARDNLRAWREAWQQHANRALYRHDRPERIDHRTLAAQRTEAVARGDHKAARVLDRTPEIHVGPRPKAMHRRQVVPRSRPSEVGAARVRGQVVRVFSESERREHEARRRIRDYPRTDSGPRIGRLWDILTGNNMKAKADIARIQRASARFTQWLDYYDRKATWYLEGQMKGAAFHRQRWLKAQADKARQAELARKAEHARRRAAQLKALTSELRALVAILSGREEAGLKRVLQVEGWARAGGREAARGRPEGRGRKRPDPSGPTGGASGGHGDNRPVW
ncbi:MobQ family relaxase [Pannonibacter carbonis]|uniref:MobQ family relaxase n=1 Tax=Pannonibacter carbonis TaxID=2067569 RepID=UPI003134652B